MTNGFNGKTLLITGGTGSFGNAVLRRFLNTDIKEIRIFSRDEKKQYDMRNQWRNSRLKFYIGDVRHYESIEPVLEGVDYIFHAAALKQVPSCEFFPMEALQTNICGTDNVVRAAKRVGVKRFVLLSTDKAVYPINAMGISKAMAEKVVIAAAREMSDDSTIFNITRYGNVMCSRGSVIPLFVDQLRKGKELTLTDPDMTRFLMSLDNAVDLVLYAFHHGRQGDTFIQKAPACTMDTLAKAVKELFDSPSEVRIIGTRHGEKKHEALLTREELIRAQDQGGYFRIPCDDRDLDYDKYFAKGSSDVSHIEDYTSESTQRLDTEDVKTLLQTLEYIRLQLDASNNPEAGLV